MIKLVRLLIDKIAPVRGILPLIGLGIVLVSMFAHVADDYWAIWGWLTINSWLLHVGVIFSVIGILIADAL